MYPRPNRIVTALNRGEIALGSLTLFQEPAIGEIMGANGFDFLIIDMEHAAASEQTVLSMVRACEAADLTPLIRLRRVEEKEILWALDTGAGGVVLPMIETAEQAREIVRVTHYPPRGQRTLCSATRASGHGSQRHDFGRFLQWFNESIVTVCLVETPEGLENLEAIIAEGIDVVMLGRADLSIKLGLGYAPSHPDVLRMAHEFVDRAVSAGATAALLSYSPQDALEWIKCGAKFIVYSQPEMMLSDGYRAAREAIMGGSR